LSIDDSNLETYQNQSEKVNSRTFDADDIQQSASENEKLRASDSFKKVVNKLDAKNTTEGYPSTDSPLDVPDTMDKIDGKQESLSMFSKMKGFVKK